ncbi:hypothetical protein DEO72_LG3g1762 [Vigna unguiculata]|uniref:Uncharacterized protein n=1 Tax=Vigna unguiculata TaxID=3917 RepID=A0A4D6LFG7_VIGUN|nr:hypothetical protein DEO72_LG3g1762 [Vigna unguiculata]
MEEMHGSKSSDCIKNEGMLLIKSTLSQEKHYVTVPSGNVVEIRLSNDVVSVQVKSRIKE